MAQRSIGPQRHRLVAVAEKLAVFVLATMVVAGFALVIWTLFHIGKEREVSDKQIALRGLMASLFLTGFTTIYCGLTGFILLESRRMRLQAIAPNIQVSTPVRSTDSVLIDLHNAGAAPAVDVKVVAWVLKTVGGTRTPDPAAVYVGRRTALPATQGSQNLKLVAATGSEASEFGSWKEHIEKANIAPDALDVCLLLVAITYCSVDGASMAQYVALPVTEQQTLPGDPSV